MLKDKVVRVGIATTFTFRPCALGTYRSYFVTFDASLSAGFTPPGRLSSVDHPRGATNGIANAYLLATAPPSGMITDAEDIYYGCVLYLSRSNIADGQMSSLRQKVVTPA